HKMDDAIAATQKAVALFPESPDLLTELASRYIDAENYADAATTLERAHKLQPEDGRIFVRLGYVYLLQGKDAQAVKMTEKGLTFLDANRERRELLYAHLNLARAWGRMGEYDVALEQLTESKKFGLKDCSELEADPKLAKFRADARYQKAKF